MKYFIIGFVIFLICMIIEMRRDIFFYLKCIFDKMKFFKKLNDSIYKNNRKRILKTKEIKQYLDIADSKIQKFYKIKKEFVIDKDLERKIKYSRFDYKYLRILLDNIFEYLELNKDDVTLEIKFISSKYLNDCAGLYREDTKNITLYINNADTYESVVSTLIHECTHHFLLSHNIRLEKRIHNEILTDITTIYLGFGKLMYEGYKHYGKIVYINSNTRGIDKRKCGYIYYGDVKSAMKLMNKYR